jgi:hypothetical protein
MLHRVEMTTNDLLSDPVVQTVMRADRVDPTSLRADLDVVARRLSLQSRPLLAPPCAAGLRRLLGECVLASREVARTAISDAARRRTGR